MDVASFLNPDNVMARCVASSKKLALHEVAREAATRTGLEEREVFMKLLGRERLGSTAMGNGVAIPHASFCGLQSPVSFFVRLQQPIEFDSPDGKPVDILFVLLAPEGGHQMHLRAMARISRILRDTHTCSEIRKAVTCEVIYALLTAGDEEPQA